MYLLSIRFQAAAALITVTTTNNAGAPAGTKSLVQALTEAQDGDTIQFNIPGPGPHYLVTPPEGYPYIRQNNLTIDGYSQPGSVPNTNSILSSNNAQIKIVLDSRNGGRTLMDYDPANGSPGFGSTESGILGVIDAANLTVRGLAFLGRLSGGVNPDQEDVKLYGLAIANSQAEPVELNTHVAGCWFGVDPGDRTTVAPTADGIAGFGKGMIGTVIGVKPGVTDAEAKASFNIFCGQSIPIIIEGNNTRISGNFIGVLPDGLHDYDVSLNPALYTGDYEWEGNIELGRHDQAIIGTDGDGVNDANERNVIGGGLPPMTLPDGTQITGYDHNIEFYGGSRSNIVVAGNYVGVGVDGQTRFTNGVPALNASGGTGYYRFGSDFDGVSDNLEGNVVFNHWPTNLFSGTNLASRLPNDANFFDELSPTAGVSYRGNKLVNNFPLPVAFSRSAQVEGNEVVNAWLTNYYSKVLADPAQGIMPLLSTNSSATNLVGQVPLPNASYTNVVLDLYLADPEGIATGRAAAAQANLTNYPAGFVQSLVYLGSLVVDGTNDLDQVPGAFRFNISNLNLQGGSNITAVANYSSTPAGTHNEMSISSPFSVPIQIAAPAGASLALGPVSVSGSNLNLRWTGATPPYQVQFLTNITDTTWVDVGAPTTETNVTLPINGNQGFYRVRSK